MDGIKYSSYINYKNDTFFKFINNDISISSGVNQFEFLDLYKDLMKLELDNQNSISTYAEPKGNQLLIDTLSYYENYLFQNNVCGHEYKLCMVGGATAGINFIFDYCSMKGMKCGLTIGYSYTLFELLAQRNGFEFHIVVSRKGEKIIPDIYEIKEYIVRYKAEFICLTDPLNPSGEMYYEDDFRELLKICKKHKCLLIIDKCQRDELQIINSDQYFSVNKLIYQEEAINNTVIINSLSKVRSIPGLRIGYVIANENIIKYIEYMNTITYWHCNSSCSFAVAIDTLYQLVFMDPKNLKQYIVDYRNMLKYFLANQYITKKIFSFLSINTIEHNANKYCCEIIKNYYTIQKNYILVKEYAMSKGYKITKLSGGYNFCIFLQSKVNEKKLKEYSNKKYRLELFTQEDFCCKEKNSKHFWIRISCAESYESFKEKFKILCSIIEKNIEYLY